MDLAQKYMKELEYAITALDLCLEDAKAKYPKSDVGVKILKSKLAIIELKDTLRQYPA